MEIKVDFYAVIIFLGIVQAIFLSIFFLSGENRKKDSNVAYGMLLLCIAATILEIFLGYTGFVQHAWHLVDFSEPFTLAIAPLFYLIVLSLIYGSLPRKAYAHLIPPAAYTCFFLFFVFQSEDIKYNAWVEAFRPELPLRQIDPSLLRWPSDLLGIRSFHTELGVLLALVYGTLCLREIIKIFKAKGEKFFHPSLPVLQSLRNGTLSLIGVGVVVLAVKATHESDTGDHLLAAFLSMIIYLISISIIRRSGFFKQAVFQDKKFRTTGLGPETEAAALEKLKTIMESEHPYRSPNFSLPFLAQRAGLTVHQLSQLLNQSLGKSFADFTAEYRVAYARKLLEDPEYRNIKLEEIAECVGYYSKSSFNAAFKKITGTTPSGYRSNL